MIQTTLKIDGMACGMCESHINDTIRRNFPVQKVTSSHKKGECVIVSEAPLEEAALHAAIDKFSARFRRVEEAVLGAGQRMEQLSLAELDAVWDRIKHKEA